jgi:hypothetical protein
MIDFPANPAKDQTFSADGVTWVWDGAKWTTSAATADFLPLSGGTLTGSLTIGDGSNAALNLIKTGPNGAPWISGFNGTSARWQLIFGTGEAETGGNAGSNFVLSRYGDNGVYIDEGFRIDRATGSATFSHDFTIIGALTVGYSITLSAGPITLPSGSMVYSDPTYFGLGESGNFTLTSSWRYMFVRSSGERQWLDWASTAQMVLDPSGNLGIIGTFSQASDASLKRDIEPASAGLDALRQIEPKSYRRVHAEPPADQPGWKVEDRRELGFIAQDVQAALPDAVVEHDGKLAITLMPLIAALTNAVKELDARLAAMEAKQA